MDTGASISVIHADLCARLRKEQTPYSGPTLCGANNVLIQPSGQCTVRVLIDGLRHHIPCAVLASCAHSLILGWDFLSSASAVISCDSPTIELSNEEVSSVCSMPPVNLTVAADCVLPPGLDTLLTVRSADINEGDILAVPCASLFSKGVVIATCLIRFCNGFANLPVTNASPEQILLREGTTVASTHQGETINVVPVGSLSTLPGSVFSDTSTSALTATISPDVTPAEAQSLLALLDKHRLSFDSFSNTLGQTTAAAHRIQTDSPHIIRRRPYRVLASERKIIERMSRICLSET